jgi:tripartite-type tricarboxylate transporter receptor subunit TctC
MRGRWVQAVSAIVALMVGLAHPARAEDYPARPVTMVVPYAAGGGLDQLARLLQSPLEQRLGKPLVIENRTGGGTVIGAASVAKAAPDGYTLLFATSSALAINVTIHKSLPYDPAKDYVPISLIANAPFVFVVTPSLPVHTIGEFIALAKEKPGTLSYTSAGPGSPQHLYSELMQSIAGIKLVHVPYRGDAPALADLVAGHVPAGFVEMGTAMPFIAQGKVRPLGVSSGKRVPAAPEIPTLAESGVPGFDAVSWQMVVAPAEVPAAIVDKLHADFTAVLALPDIKAEFQRTGRISVEPQPPPALSVYIKSEIVRWGKVVQAAGIAGTQ